MAWARACCTTRATTSTTTSFHWVPPCGYGWRRPGLRRDVDGNVATTRAPAPMRAADAFAQSYAEARQKFLAAARAAGLSVRSHDHPRRGRDGEPLAMDVALQGT